MINPTNRSRNSCIFQIRNHNIFCGHFPVASVEQIEVKLCFVKGKTSCKNDRNIYYIIEESYQFLTEPFHPAFLVENEHVIPEVFCIRVWRGVVTRWFRLSKLPCNERIANPGTPDPL